MFFFFSQRGPKSQYFILQRIGLASTVHQVTTWKFWEGEEIFGLGRRHDCLIAWMGEEAMPLYLKEKNKVLMFTSMYTFCSNRMPSSIRKYRIVSSWIKLSLDCLAAQVLPIWHTIGFVEPCKRVGGRKPYARSHEGDSKPVDGLVCSCLKPPGNSVLA